MHGNKFLEVTMGLAQVGYGSLGFYTCYSMVQLFEKNKEPELHSYFNRNYMVVGKMDKVKTENIVKSTDFINQNLKRF
jgi:hypothetical protein